MALGLHRREAGPLVDAPRRDELAIARGPGERDALVDEPLSDPVPARAGFDEQQPELRDGVALPDAEDRADPLAVELGDPAALALRVEVLDELRDDGRDEGLEALVPAVLLPVERAVTLDDPAH